MTRRSINTQMFALPEAPPETVEIAGERYRRVRVFKHDFYAATCLYEACRAGGDFAKIVVKFGRTRDFCGFGAAWFGEAMRRHEEAIYRTLAGVKGVPRWVGSFGRSGYAIEYVDGVPLDHVGAPSAGFFDRLRKVFDEIHARGVGYADGNKRSNILVGPGGEPFVVDYQISIRRRDDLPWPLRAINRRFVSYIIRKDLYHLYKHKRRISPHELTEEEEALSRRRSGLHLLHRKLTKPWRVFRRRFLRRQYQSGRLVSPTAEMEDHHQPEKATWRQTQGADRKSDGARGHRAD